MQHPASRFAVLALILTSFTARAENADPYNWPRLLEQGQGARLAPLNTRCGYDYQAFQAFSSSYPSYPGLKFSSLVEPVAYSGSLVPRNDNIAITVDADNPLVAWLMSDAYEGLTSIVTGLAPSSLGVAQAVAPGCVSARFDLAYPKLQNRMLRMRFRYFDRNVSLHFTVSDLAYDAQKGGYAVKFLESSDQEFKFLRGKTGRLDLLAYKRTVTKGTRPFDYARKPLLLRVDQTRASVSCAINRAGVVSCAGNGLLQSLVSDTHSKREARRAQLAQQSLSTELEVYTAGKTLR